MASLKMEKFQRWMVPYISMLLFFTGFLWILLFPSFSISTGETKARGLYVDEHALLVKSKISQSFNLKVVIENSAWNNCEGMLGQCTMLSFGDDQKLLEINVDSRFSYRSPESTLLVFNNYDASMRKLLLKLVAVLTESNWLARRIIILAIFPSGEQNVDNRFSPSLELWLKCDFDNESCSRNDFRGLIRDAYIIENTPDRNVTDQNPWQELSFDSIALRSTGINGQTPNMDMVSYPLSIFTYPFIRTESDDSCNLAAPLFTGAAARKT